MAWVKLGTTTLDAASTEINVAVTSTVFLHVLRKWQKDTTKRVTFKFDDDASTYAGRWSDVGGGTQTESASIGYPQGYNGYNTTPHFSVEFISNVATQEKMAMGFMIMQGTAGAANVPDRQDFTGKHDNASSAITEVNTHLGVTSGHGEFLSGSNTSVLGYQEP